MVNPKIIITTGGTGGHIFPALALAEQLIGRNPTCELLFVGGKLVNNPYFSGQQFPYHEVACSTFTIKQPLAFLRATVKIGQGIWQSYRLLRSFQPHVVVGFGSFYTLPVLLAAKGKGVPFLLHEANSVPGKVNRLLAPFAAVTGIHFPETAQHLKGKTLEVGLPLRKAFVHQSVPKETARTLLGLDPLLPTLLAFGGSQGAQAINQLLPAALLNFSTSQRSKMQLLHIAGKESEIAPLRTFYAQENIKALVKAFEPRMDLAWQAADCAFCRAGASTVAEAVEFEVPALMMPYPYAENHQENNADFFADVAKGGLKIKQQEITAEKLATLLSQWLDTENNNLPKMRAAMHAYKEKTRSKDLCQLVLDHC